MIFNQQINDCTCIPVYLWPRPPFTRKNLDRHHHHHTFIHKRVHGHHEHGQAECGTHESKQKSHPRSVIDSQFRLHLTIKQVGGEVQLVQVIPHFNTIYRYRLVNSTMGWVMFQKSTSYSAPSATICQKFQVNAIIINFRCLSRYTL